MSLGTGVTTSVGQSWQNHLVLCEAQAPADMTLASWASPPLLACLSQSNGFWVEVKEAFLNPGKPRLLCTSGLGAWGCGSAIEHLPRIPSVKQTPA